MSQTAINCHAVPLWQLFAILGSCGVLACGNPISYRVQNFGEPGSRAVAEAKANSPGTKQDTRLSKPSEPDIDDTSDDDYGDLDAGENSFDHSHRPHPYDSLSDSDLREAVEKHPETLGSLSIGSPNSGQLINGVRPTESPLLYHLVDPDHAWGTAETVNSVCHAVSVVANLHPGTAAIDIGHLSAKQGGPLSPHRSHQSGRDVDLGLYYRESGTPWYTRATRDTLDVARTWTLIRTLITSTDIEMILLDQELKEATEHYALSAEPDPTWVFHLFHRNGAKPALIRHSPGHKTHLHLRFLNPMAQESAKRLAPFLTAHHLVRVPAERILYVARRGDTLAHLAERYHTSMIAIRQANGMQSFQLVAGHRYAIPLSGSLTSSEPPQPPVATSLRIASRIELDASITVLVAESTKWYRFH